MNVPFTKSRVDLVHCSDTVSKKVDFTAFYGHRDHPPAWEFNQDFNTCIFFKGENSSAIEEMLLLINEYGLSHVCAKTEFKNTEFDGDGKVRYNYIAPVNFPYLDILVVKNSINITHFTPHFQQTFEPMFYFRGAKEKTMKFNNLFEYILSTVPHGQG